MLTALCLAFLLRYRRVIVDFMKARKKRFFGSG